MSMKTPRLGDFLSSPITFSRTRSASIDFFHSLFLALIPLCYIKFGRNATVGLKYFVRILVCNIFWNSIPHIFLDFQCFGSFVSPSCTFRHLNLFPLDFFITWIIKTFVSRNIIFKTFRHTSRYNRLYSISGLRCLYIRLLRCFVVLYMSKGIPYALKSYIGAMTNDQVDCILELRLCAIWWWHNVYIIQNSKAPEILYNVFNRVAPPC